MSPRWAAGALAACAVLAGCGETTRTTGNAGAASTRTISGRNIAPSYRFAKPPIVVFTSFAASPNVFTFHVYMRVRKPLPQDRRHRVRPNLSLDGTYADGDLSTTARRPPCYAGEIASENAPPDAPQIRRPRDGQLVTVRLSVRGRELASARVRAHRARSSGAFDRRYLRRLGCLR